MITLTVKSFNGAPTDGLSVAFDELGGTIGRADTNQLVLPDPERTISRVHAQVVFRNGGYAVVDRGSNPIAVNGRPLGNGTEAPIKPGDEVQIGGYLLAVVAARTTSAPADDPFADLLGPPGAAAAKPGLPPDPLAPRTAPSRGASGAPLAAASRGTSPSAARGGASAAPRGGAPSADPFAAFGLSAPSPSAPAPAPRGGAIPDDWNPFAPDSPAPADRDPVRAAPSRGARGFGLDAAPAAPAPLIPELSGGGAADSESIDRLFGLTGTPGGGDPLANSVLDAAAARPNTAGASDPLQALQSAPRATAPTARDDVSDLNRPFPATSPAVRPLAAGTPAGASAAPVATPAVPQGAVLSWDDKGGENRTVIHPRAAASTPPPAAAAQADAADAFGPLRTPAVASAQSASGAQPPAAVARPPTGRPVAETPPAAASPRTNATAAASTSKTEAAPTADAAALLAAFREGLAMPSVRVEALTPEFMHLLGELVRESTAGTVDLLVARAVLKREVRAQATMIVAKENNPLKFSPSAEAALALLFAPPTRGFMPAAPAMRDAYEDLRAHQFGFVAGMRAALEGVLERFDPAQLEQHLAQRGSALHALLPGSRKARLWELFNDLYAQIRSEAADDFHTLFGKAFLAAYEEHIAQLHDGDER